MNEEDAIDDAKKASAVVGELIKSAGDSDEAKEASANLGKAAVTITKSINNLLLPLAAVNYGVEKARIYFENSFATDLESRTEHISTDKVTEPSAVIAGPAIQALVYAHDVPELKDLYLSILATSMNTDTSDLVHPCFVEIIRQFSVFEANLFGEISKRSFEIPIIEIRKTNSQTKSFIVLESNIAPSLTGDEESISSLSKPSMVITNLARLGVIRCDYTKFVSGDQAYNWVENHPQYVRHYTEANNGGWEVGYQKGALELTEIGLQLGRSVGLRD